MNSGGRFDVAVVGASVAGCAAARLFAQQGLKVALIERRPDRMAYKVACTHAILPAAVPAIERLGLVPALRARGALRTQAEVWTPYGGWFGFPPDAPDGWGVTRRTLDPLLRELALETAGVEYFPGLTAVRLLHHNGRPGGIELEDSSRRALAVRVPLVVGADGRGSTVARLARVPGRIRAHNRFFYFAYWRGLRPRTTINRLWLLDPDCAAQFPNEDDLTVLVVAPHRARMAEFRNDLEGAYARLVHSLPDVPDLAQGERVSKLIGKLEVPNVIRPAARPGVAFIGDAALATDPVFGVGLTFALQSAEWLASEAVPALRGGRDLDSALRRYRRRFLWRLGPHHLQIADYATGRRTTPWERIAFRAATTDPAVALAIGEVVARVGSPARMLDPRVLARALRAGGSPSRTAPSARAAMNDLPLRALAPKAPTDPTRV